MGVAKKNKKTEHFLYTFDDKGRQHIRELTTLRALENIFRNL
jgi:nicotinamide mononucleotide (NMN) deamidase PncC